MPTRPSSHLASRDSSGAGRKGIERCGGVRTKPLKASTSCFRSSQRIEWLKWRTPLATAVKPEAANIGGVDSRDFGVVDVGNQGTLEANARALRMERRGNGSLRPCSTPMRLLQASRKVHGNLRSPPQPCPAPLTNITWRVRISQ